MSPKQPATSEVHLATGSKAAGNDHSSRRSLRSLIVNLTLVFVAFLLLGVAIWSNRIELAKVFAKPINGGALAVGFVIYIGALVLTFLRWHWLVRTLNIPFRRVDAIRLGFVGNIFNLVIPGAVGGDVVKAMFLARARPDRKASAVASMVIDRLLGLAGLFLLASIAGIFAFGRANPQAKMLIGITWGALFAGLCGLALLFTPRLYPLLNKLAFGKPKIGRILHELEQAAFSYRERIGVVVACLLASCGIHSLYVLAFYMASRAIFETIPTLAEHLLMVPLVLFTTAVPLPFGALGLTENASGIMFGLVGHPNGAVAMMAFRVLMYGSGLVGALVYLANFKQIQGLTKHETVDKR